MYDYNTYYKKESYFGEAYPELIEYFKSLPKSYHILDIGCGQGRDAIALTTLGFTVTGIDASSLGISQLQERAKALNLHITTEVADMYTYDITHFDVLLLDSMFHFYKNDMKTETKFFHSLVDRLKMNGYIVLAMQYNKARVSYLKGLIKKRNLSIELERDITYKEYNSKYILFSLKKTNETV